MILPLLLAAVGGYFLGAMPWGWLIARRFGINIFEHGSKNPGATNVKRVLGEKFGSKGKRAGDLAFLLDALKGALAAGWPLWVLNSGLFLRASPAGEPGISLTVQPPFTPEQISAAAITGLLFALIGHSFSCWTRFKGGKGVATSAGGLVVLLPLPTLVAVGVWVAAFYTTRYVSLASILAAIALPAAAWVFAGTPAAFAILATILGVFVIIRHRANIARLYSGTEHRFGTPPRAS